jgi:nucleotidyltransferase/DNA polymerase involved in DNA repair
MKPASSASCLRRDVALRIREKIKAETGLNASAGIS